MDRLAALNQLPLDHGIAGMLLSTVPTRRVLTIYRVRGLITMAQRPEIAPHGGGVDPNVLVTADFQDFVHAGWRFFGAVNQDATTDQIEFVFTRIMAITFRWVRMTRPQHLLLLRQIENLRIADLPMDRPPVYVSGELQYLFRVRMTYRGVAAVARLPIDALVAHCLVGLEMIASMARYLGPLFAVAFNGTMWCVLIWPRAGAQIDRTQASINMADQLTAVEFHRRLREAVQLVVMYEYRN